MGTLQWIQSRPTTGAVINCTASVSVQGAQTRPKFWLSFCVDIYAYLLGVFGCQSHGCITETGAPPTLVPQNILFHQLQINTVPYILSHQCLNLTARTISFGSYKS